MYTHAGCCAWDTFAPAASFNKSLAPSYILTPAPDFWKRSPCVPLYTIVPWNARNSRKKRDKFFFLPLLVTGNSICLSDNWRYGWRGEDGRLARLVRSVPSEINRRHWHVPLTCHFFFLLCMRDNALLNVSVAIYFLHLGASTSSSRDGLDPRWQRYWFQGAPCRRVTLCVRRLLCSFSLFFCVCVDPFACLIH